MKYRSRLSPYNTSNKNGVYNKLSTLTVKVNFGTTRMNNNTNSLDTMIKKTIQRITLDHS
jgi:hypothetical protein